MDVLKSLNGWSKRLYGADGIPLDFASLAWNAASCPISNVLQHGTARRSALMRRLWHKYLDGEIMERAEILSKAKSLAIWAPLFSTDITEDFKSISI
ncbi:hypothetical protein TNIN_165621 [Trichonephila inaurata madagascariensis]|uniref:Uncharacterized protein n=1 Tax=Trichonephila inaurata madagascariensis TaxID=2747483 RepID=A0A8X6YCS0_9ARAC|nr:hypothetical protein TNIN_165621 [Trichonephila inaurata madagascariensis]